MGDGPRAAQRGPALAGPPAALLPRAAPDERRRCRVPAAHRRRQPVHDLPGPRGMGAVQGAADEEALDRLGQVEPRAAPGGVQRPAAVSDQPTDQRRRPVAGQVVEHERPAQGGQGVRQREADGQPLLPGRPAGARGGGQRRGRALGQDGGQLALEPRAPHGVRGPLDRLRPLVARGRAEQGQPLGPGLNSLDALTALENWVERGIAPDQIIASHTPTPAGPGVARTRPLCSYPAVAVYTGRGDPNDAANFTCKNRGLGYSLKGFQSSQP